MSESHGTQRRFRSPLVVIAVVALLFDLGWGMAMCFGTVPFTGWDEPWHFVRAEQVSRGELLPTRLGDNNWGGHVDAHALALAISIGPPVANGAPVSMATFRQIAATGRATGPEMVVASFPNSATYPPLAYLPNAAGIAAARALGGDLLIQTWCGRVTGLVGYLALVALAVRVLPTGRLVALALLGGPTAIYLASCFSADPMNTALPALLVAWCLRLRHRPLARLGVWRVACGVWRGALLLLLAVSMAQLKVTSVVFAAAVLLIPVGRLGSRRVYAAFVATALLGASLAAAAWTRAYPFRPGLFFHHDVDPHRAASGIVADPSHFLSVLWRTMSELAWPLWRASYARFGGGPSPYNFVVDGPWCLLALVLLLALALTQIPTRRDPLAGLSMAAFSAAIALAILVAFYIAFTSANAGVIDGLQGRYFITSALTAFLSVAILAARWPLPGQAMVALNVGLMASWIVLQGMVVTSALERYARCLAKRCVAARSVGGSDRNLDGLHEVGSLVGVGGNALGECVVALLSAGPANLRSAGQALG